MKWTSIAKLTIVHICNAEFLELQKNTQKIMESLTKNMQDKIVF